MNAYEIRGLLSGLTLVLGQLVFGQASGVDDSFTTQVSKPVPLRGGSRPVQIFSAEDGKGFHVVTAKDDKNYVVQTYDSEMKTSATAGTVVSFPEFGSTTSMAAKGQLASLCVRITDKKDRIELTHAIYPGTAKKASATPLEAYEPVNKRRMFKESLRLHSANGHFGFAVFTADKVKSSSILLASISADGSERLIKEIDFPAEFALQYARIDDLDIGPQGQVVCTVTSQDFGQKKPMDLGSRRCFVFVLPMSADPVMRELTVAQHVPSSAACIFTDQGDVLCAGVAIGGGTSARMFSAKLSASNEWKPEMAENAMSAELATDLMYDLLENIADYHNESREKGRENAREDGISKAALSLVPILMQPVPDGYMFAAEIRHEAAGGAMGITLQGFQIVAFRLYADGSIHNPLVVKKYTQEFGLSSHLIESFVFPWKDGLYCFFNDNKESMFEGAGARPKSYPGVNMGSLGMDKVGTAAVHVEDGKGKVYRRAFTPKQSHNGYVRGDLCVAIAPDAAVLLLQSDGNGQYVRVNFK